MADPVALRLPENLVSRLDALVAAGAFATRTEAIRSAIESMLRERDEADMDVAIAEGYRRLPETADELNLARSATRAMIAEEPW